MRRFFLAVCVASALLCVPTSASAEAIDRPSVAPVASLMFEAAFGGASDGVAFSTGVLARYSIVEGGFFMSARTYVLGASSIGYTPAIGLSMPLSASARVEILGVGGVHHYVGCENAPPSPLLTFNCAGPQTADGDEAFAGGWVGVTMRLRPSLPPMIGVWAFVESDFEQKLILADDKRAQLQLGEWQFGAVLRVGFDFRLK